MYPGSSVVEATQNRLRGYSGSLNAIQYVMRKKTALSYQFLVLKIDGSSLNSFTVDSF